MRTLNLGILAHIDAGKTSLTEQLLKKGGIIDEIGRVDEGSTHTDSLEQERRRGITIKSAVVSFELNNVTVNLIDTPGHPDFIAEIERVLGVLDGAILVVSAVEGVQAQTLVLMRALKRLQISTLIFVNKIDRPGAQFDQTIKGISKRLTKAVIPMGSTINLGEPNADFIPGDDDDIGFKGRLAELLAERNDEILTEYLDEKKPVSYSRLYKELRTQVQQVLVHPVFFGSAITGAGVDTLMTGITDLLPVVNGDSDGPVSGVIFKIERGSNKEKSVYVRMFSGTLEARDKVQINDKEQKVKAIRVFTQGDAVSRPCISAGQIGELMGLSEVQIGDAIGNSPASFGRQQFAPPTLETAIVPRRDTDRGRLHAALTQLAEQDPFINLRTDDIKRETYVSLYGEVQKEIIQEALATEFGVEVDFSETTPVCIERPLGIGAALEKAPDPFIATVGLRIEPAEVSTDIDFLLEVEQGSLPASFFKAVEDSVKDTLRQGLFGWRVADCRVTMTHSIRYRDWATSTAADHRNLTPLVVMAALKQAKTQVCEPIHSFHIEIPSDTLGLLLPVLASLHATPLIPQTRGSICTIEGQITTGKIQVLQRQLLGLSRGEGFMETTFNSYQPVTGEVPTRPRTDNNPLNRKEYLMRVASRT